MTLLHLAYRPPPGREVAARMFDFSPASLAERWAAGRRDTARALDLLASRPGRSRERFAYVAAPAGDDDPDA